MTWRLPGAGQSWSRLLIKFPRKILGLVLKESKTIINLPHHKHTNVYLIEADWCIYMYRQSRTSLIQIFCAASIINLNVPFVTYLSTGPLGTSFNEIWIDIHDKVTKMYLKMSFTKYRPFCLSLKVLMPEYYKGTYSHQQARAVCSPIPLHRGAKVVYWRRTAPARGCRSPVRGQSPGWWGQWSTGCGSSSSRHCTGKTNIRLKRAVWPVISGWRTLLE